MDQDELMEPRAGLEEEGLGQAHGTGKTRSLFTDEHPDAGDRGDEP